MLELLQTTPTSYDCTCGYKVLLRKVYTVCELINEILKRNEFGWISVYKKDTIVYHIEFKRRDILEENKEISEILMNSIVESANCCGGYGRMDYEIYLL